MTLDQVRRVALALPALEPEAVEKLFWGPRAIGLKIALRRASPGAIKALLSSA